MGQLVEKVSGQSCPICRTDSITTTRPEDREYTRCSCCGVIRTRFHYNARLYGKAYAKTYLGYAAGPANTPLNLFRLGLVSRWLLEGEKILDIGCCVGEFLRFAEHYYQCTGFEPNTEAARSARHRCSSPVVSTLDGGVPKVECITLFDVLEHLEDPKEFLTMLKVEYLYPKGIIVITTPDVSVIEPWDDKRLRKWKHYKPQEHLWLYTEQALAFLANLVGEVVHVGREESDIRPGNPDGDLLTCVIQAS